jgi:SRSO17 transposase
LSVAVPSSARSREQRFQHYLDRLTDSVGHADRCEPFRLYTTGLLLPGERKSVEPMAARVDPLRVRSRHQSLHHLVAEADWSDAAVLATVRDAVLPTFASSGGVSAWIVDETGFPKKGQHSVGVARQYCGQVGKQDNCRVAVSLSVATPTASLPLAFRLYLPQEWIEDSARCRKIGVPDEVSFQTKPEMALAQIRPAIADGVPPGTVLADVVYGNDTRFREGVAAWGLHYVVAVQAHTSVWREGQAPLLPSVYKGNGRPPKLLRRDEQHQPVSVQQVALALLASSWRTVTGSEGRAGPLRSRFAHVRVRAVHRDYWRGTLREEEWLLAEWPASESAPTKYWLSTLPRATSLRQLVETTKRRWRIERDDQELKQELGLGHYEGRDWHGFHSHATLCIAADGFLVAERAAFSRSAFAARPSFKVPRLPRGFQLRGAASTN